MNKLQAITTGLASIQWLFFIFTNTIVVPISIGLAFDLTAAETAMTVRSSLIFTGIACVIQGLWGHRYPLMEGHSGLTWGLLLSLSASASALGMDLQTIGGGIATGILASGAFMLVIGLFGLVPMLQKIFSSMVMSVYLFLLTLQLILIFFAGMLKLTPTGQLDVPVSLFSIGIVVFVSVLKIKGKESISNFSILIGIVVGWILYRLLFNGGEGVIVESSAFHLFPLGTPNLEWGIVAVTFVAGVINMSNTIASIQAAGILYKDTPSSKVFNRSISWTGFYTIAAGGLGLVPYAPYTSSIGFLESTRIFERKPFIIGGLLFSLLGIIPAAGAFFATIPVTVGNAVLFVAYLQLFGTTLKSLNGTEFNSNSIFRLAVPVLAGVSLMAIDPIVFSNLPVYIQPIVSNGFIMGVLISIVLEMLVDWEKV
ncbi:xanthine/uracil permease [Bacillus ectoiniformans]|uniref:uracil/xanthine transporter n=1 Tax=Bacillus ectoiniformans TaxID=1494429 RepID=UPI001958A893|nr:uracil/xanthine transporter [Bacillus ectoiniformans]MBM7650248.1 xanthine/uracil permease [Bacillus ectoiniformans]